jgi:hypothetical protein
MTVEVDDAGAGSMAREFENLALGADFHNNATADGDGLGYRAYLTTALPRCSNATSGKGSASRA